ncbi:hypothetical protein QBC39DRAFT_378071 [Podospora conica]|nr:hypothetical protein QBC39DRAFT_378071 [Schizothecium conicum]
MDAQQAASLLNELQTYNLSHWGFTLYRTDYDPPHEPQWIALVNALNQATLAEICNNEPPYDELTGELLPAPPADAPQNLQLLHQVCSAFHLDVRSNQELYGDADLNALRKIHLDELRHEHGVRTPPRDGGEPQLAAPVEKFVFLLADAEDLADGRREGWVKAVDAKYEAKQHESGRRARQHYWGWMKMELGACRVLWSDVKMMGEMSEVAPPSYEGARAAGVYEGMTASDSGAGPMSVSRFLDSSSFRDRVAGRCG